jgi:hypothetical protein
MSGPSSVVRNYVKNFAANYLGSMRNSQQVEGKYGQLDARVKVAATRELERIAERFTDELLRRVDSEYDLASFENDAILREALSAALSYDA